VTDPETDIAAARLTPELAARYADIALGHVTREYPNKLDHVLDGPADAATPRALHPIFFGSFDWHSCVHAYWMLATLLRLYPEGAAAGRIAALFDAMLTEAKVAGELAYLARPSSRGFERPYGWAWLLALAAGLLPVQINRSSRRRPYDLGPALRWDERIETWSGALQPLAEAFADRFKAFLPRAEYPIRTGSHANTAFALRLAFDYAEAVGDRELAALIRERARLWYGQDRGAPAWEPSGDDFLSPTLVEAQLMADPRVNPDAAAWLAAFLPDVAAERPATLFRPAGVSDRSDGKIAHLDGLNLSRAWCWRSLANALDGNARDRAQAAAERHLAASLPHVAGDYMGEHWLATYALLALEA
jgi:hypothetical protein